MTKTWECLLDASLLSSRIPGPKFRWVPPILIDFEGILIIIDLHSASFSVSFKQFQSACQID